MSERERDRLLTPRSEFEAATSADLQLEQLLATLGQSLKYHVFFTPTSASWVNQFERWFAEPLRSSGSRTMSNAR